MHVKKDKYRGTKGAIQVYKYDKARLSRIFTFLLRCPSPSEMESQLPEGHRGMSTSAIGTQAQAAVDSSQFQEAALWMRSGMVAALKEGDWDYCYSFGIFAFVHSLHAGVQTLAETIAFAWPILAYCETHNPKGPRRTNIVAIIIKFVEESKSVQRATNDQELGGLTGLALDSLQILIARADQIKGRTLDGGAPTDRAEVDKDASNLEVILGLIGMREWVRKNFQ